MPNEPGYTGAMKRVHRFGVMRIVIAILATAFATTSCLITPRSPTGGGRAAPPEAGDGTSETVVNAVGDEEPASTGVAEPGDNLQPPGEPESIPATEPEESSPDEMPVRRIAAGSQSAVRVPAAVTITDQSVLDEVWLAIHANQLSRPEVPQIDFGSETVIILILGERPSAGYSVRVAGFTRWDSAVEVRIEVVSPGPDAVTASVLTSPFELSALEITGMPVTFVGDDLWVGFIAGE